MAEGFFYTFHLALKHTVLKHLYSISILFLLTIFIVSCSEDENQDDLLTLIAADPNLSTLNEAIALTDLNATIRVSQNVSILAPTNEAFERYFASFEVDGLEDFSSLEDIDLLRNLLLNHVILGVFEIEDLRNGFATSLAVAPENNNVVLYFGIDGGVKINGQSEIILANREASNGMLHVVDEVIELSSIMTYIEIEESNFSVLNQVLNRSVFADIREYLGNPYQEDGAPYTFFAPTNAAFTALVESNDSWNNVSEIPDGTLREVLLHHIIENENISSRDFGAGITTPATLQGEPLVLLIPSPTGSPVGIQDGSGNNRIQMVAADLQAANGIMHVVNQVMMPN